MSVTKSEVTTLLSEDDDTNEIIINVSEEFASYSLGFAIDSGGSLMKLLYRSKKDYKNGVKLQNDIHLGGILRLRSFSEPWDILSFLEENVDIVRRESSLNNQQRGNEIDNIPTFFQSGVGVQHLIQELDKRINIKTKLLYEEQAIGKALQRLYLPSSLPNSTEVETKQAITNSPRFRPLPVTQRGFEKALHGVRLLMNMMAKFKDSDATVAVMIPQNSTQNPCSSKEPSLSPEEYGLKLLAQDSTELSQEMSVKEIELPCLMVMIGSGMVINKIDLDGKQQMCDYNPCGGKMIVGLAIQLSGAKDFSALMEMAARGDPNKVNILSGDIKSHDRLDTDFYSLMPEEFPVFDLGKLADELYKGTYTTEDIVAGLLKAFCRLITKIVVANAKLYNYTTVLFGGSFVNHPILREFIEEAFYYEVLLVPFFGMDMIKMAVLEHPGHLCTLGTWQHNLELELQHGPTDKTLIQQEIKHGLTDEKLIKLFKKSSL